jgi:hypothetical protein
MTLVDQRVKRVLLCERRRRLEVVILEALTSYLLAILSVSPHNYPARCGPNDRLWPISTLATLQHHV